MDKISMKSIKIVLLFFGVFISWALALGNEGGQISIPSLTGPVVDEAQLLSREGVLHLEQIIRDVRERGGIQAQILIVPTIVPEEIESFSMRVVDSWKLGSKEKDDGVLILVVTQDRKMRIEVGQGLEGVLPDVAAKRIIRNDMAPAFKQGFYTEGLQAALESIFKASQGEFPPDKKVLFQDGKIPGPVMLLFLILLVIFFALKGGGGGGTGFRGGSGWGSTGGWGGGSSSSRSGGWSGGGGGFSGGGASGDW